MYETRGLQTPASGSRTRGKCKTLFECLKTAAPAPCRRRRAGRVQEVSARHSLSVLRRRRLADTGEVELGRVELRVQTILPVLSQSYLDFRRSILDFSIIGFRRGILNSVANRAHTHTKKKNTRRSCISLSISVSVSISICLSVCLSIFLCRAPLLSGCRAGIRESESEPCGLHPSRVSESSSPGRMSHRWRIGDTQLEKLKKCVSRDRCRTGQQAQRPRPAMVLACWRYGTREVDLH